MYHIPNDARALKSAELLFNGLICLMNKKLFTDITVTDLVDVSGVSRATYYRLFDNITDILSWKLNVLIAASIEEIKKQSTRDFKCVFYKFIQYWDGHRDFVSGLIKAGKSDLISEAHRVYMDDIKKYMLADKNINDIQKEYLVEYLAALIPITFRVSEKHPAKKPEEYYDDVVSSLAILWNFLND